MKTDSPDLYNFTKKVIALYGCELQTDLDDVHSSNEIPEVLKIKTHYESLDIAGSNRIHYLSFSLPANIPSIEKDMELQEILKQEEGVGQ